MPPMPTTLSSRRSSGRCDRAAVVVDDEWRLRCPGGAVDADRDLPRRARDRAIGDGTHGDLAAAEDAGVVAPALACLLYGRISDPLTSPAKRRAT